MRKRVKQNKVGLGIAIALILVSVFGGAYYLYANNFLGSTSTLAALENSYKIDLNGYELELKPIGKSGGADGVSKVNWSYTVKGVYPTCYNVKTNVSASNPLDTSSTEKLKFIVTRFDYDTKKCTGAQDLFPPNGRISEISKGVFEANENEPFRYIVVYYSTPVNGVAPISISLNDFKFKTDNLKDFTVKGNSSDCYTPSAFAVKNGDDPTFFQGTYGLRLTKVSEVNQNCTDTSKKVSVTGRVDTKFLKGFKARFSLRYVYNGTLNSDKVFVNRIVKDGVVLRYQSDGQGNYTYTLSGTLPNSCYTVTSSEYILNSGRKVIVEAKKLVSGTNCQEIAKTFNISGNFKASKTALINLVVTEVQANPD